MKRNHFENSLKRWLKKRVKITLGFVVAFMITGAVGYAEPVINDKGTEKNEWHKEQAEKYLAGLGQNITLNGKIEAENVTINSYGDGEIKITNSGKEIIISKADISSETLKNLQTSLNLLTGNGTVINNEALGFNEGLGLRSVGNTTVGDMGIHYAESISGSGNVFVVEKYEILKTQQRAENGASIVNKGKILYNKNFGQLINCQDGQSTKSIGYNYGIIANTGTNGQYTKSTDQSGKNIGYNYGIIANTGNFGQNSEKSINYNYGIITNAGSYGQYTQGGIIYNYGFIANADAFGQSIEQVEGTAYNYGIIANAGDGGQLIATGTGYNYGIIKNGKNNGINISNNGKAYNYGIVANKGDNGMAINQNGIGYNYGIIANKGSIGIQTSDSGKAYNYGVVKNTTGTIFKGSGITNYGIAILTTENLNKTGMGSGNNKGVLLDKNYNLFKSDYNSTEHILDFTTISDAKITGNEDKSTYFTKDNNVQISSNTLTEKVLTGVVKDKGGITLYEKDGDLTLKNTTIVGYFENNGTLLEVNGDLTLEGESVINAIAGNSYTGYTGKALNDVVAVKLAENGTLTIGENSKVLGAVKGNGTLIYENSKGTHSNTQEINNIFVRTTAGERTNAAFSNIKLNQGENIGKFVIDNQSNANLDNKKVSTSITLANNIEITEIDGSSSTNGFELILGDEQASSDNTIKTNSITLGNGDDVITINNKLSGLSELGVVIDGNDGNDTVILKNSTGNHDTFDYKLKDINTLDLDGKTWKIGEKAGISHTSSVTKSQDKTTIQNGTLRADMKFEVKDIENTAVFKNANVSDVLAGADFGDKGYLQLGIGAGSELEAGKSYTTEFKGVNEDYVKVSGIFNKDENNNNKLSIKTAREMNVDEKYAEIYNEMLRNAKYNTSVLAVLNNSEASGIADMVNQKGRMGETLGTTGYKITRDISNSFMSAVNEWNKKAGKGEWLANAKYINSDVEYDGANDVKGYDSDIKSMVGMIEYGVSEKTAYGIALGGGDTEIDVDGAGKLEGDNYYVGAYVKHEVNGFDIVGNLGYTISDLEVDGNGSADSSAITFGGYVKKDVRLTDTIKLEPNVSFTYDYIMQDDAEGNGVKVEGKDIHVFEASAGMNIVKEFAFETGKLELRAGAKYSMADINRNEETVISVYGIDDINLGNPEVDKTRGTAHIGFDYEHETGFGVNGKYEMMWSDSGDDSRITAGVSYRF